jgi:RNA polymerase sigma factor (sigma-70 family)
MRSDLFDRASAGRWGLTPEAFNAAVDASIAHAFAGRTPSPDEIDRYVQALHLQDLALAVACAAGRDEAWEHFVREYRSVLYRAAAAIERVNAAELADSLYAELYGVRGGQAAGRSLFGYFHGRSSLATWLRAVLAQRQIDGARSRRSLEALPSDDSLAAPGPADPDRPRYVAAMRAALAAAMTSLAPRDRLRLRGYYGQAMTLAAIGRLLGEHEATVSRHLARTRSDVRREIDRILRDEHGFDEPARDACFRSVVEDAGTLELADVIGDAPEPDLGVGVASPGLRKVFRFDRSK